MAFPRRTRFGRPDLAAGRTTASNVLTAVFALTPIEDDLAIARAPAGMGTSN
jgi:hypothetical protein